IGTGDSDGALDASNIIKPFLARGQMQLIGTTTTAEYRKHFEKDKAFSRRFQPIIANEPDEETAIKMLNIIKQKYEAFHKVVILDDAIKASVQLSKKYIGERYLPDKAIDLLDEAAAQVRLEQSEGKRNTNQVAKTDIEKIVSSWTGIPITRLTEDESQKLLELENLMHKRLINQESAVSSVAEAVRRGRIGLASANRPIASFVFLGPTGVGKTELAKTLAEILFGRDDAMIRLDMSEYMEKHTVARLIGAPPGYVGYEEGGQLTEAVRRRPYAVILFDEIEKAHPDVFNLLLQILDDGRLTDGHGRTVDFKNTVIIMTSNIGSQWIFEFGDKEEEMKQKVMELVHSQFKPEFLNRLDEIIIFHSLKLPEIVKIVDIQFGILGKRLLDKKITISLTQKARDFVAKSGYDPLFGARPIKRTIQHRILDPLAMKILNKEFLEGDTVEVDVKKDEITFRKKSG
ncbi:MAG: AAA family ATPase, partial [Candidatus Methanoperedens sp.]|nr:AAA family ATPase [Candidatus Methanoperedens sp.]